MERDVAEAVARVMAQVQVQAQAQVRVAQLVQAEAQESAVARAEALVRVLKGEWVAEEQAAYTIGYDEVLADSKLVDIIYSIEPDCRQRLAREVPTNLREYRWFIQIITPITRLPPELLHQILLIVIDDASHSPLVVDASIQTLAHHRH